MEVISSMQNPKVKRLARLRTKAPLRKQTGLIWVEGVQEIKLAVENGFQFEEMYYTPDVLSEVETAVLTEKATVSYALSLDVIKKISYRGHTEGVIGLFQLKKTDLATYKPDKNACIIILEAVEKPGNLGAVLRTADAAGVEAVFICDPHTDIFHPNAVRASVGACFTVPVYQTDTQSAIQFLKKHEIQLFAAALQNAKPYYAVDLKKSAALVFGTESTGLTAVWREAADQVIQIPMQGKLDSLNVSNSVAILAFEAVRQKNQSESV